MENTIDIAAGKILPHAHTLRTKPQDCHDAIMISSRDTHTTVTKRSSISTNQSSSDFSFSYEHSPIAGPDRYSDDVTHYYTCRDSLDISEISTINSNEFEDLSVLSSNAINIAKSSTESLFRTLLVGLSLVRIIRPKIPLEIVFGKDLMNDGSLEEETLGGVMEDLSFEHQSATKNDVDSDKDSAIASENSAQEISTNEDPHLVGKEKQLTENALNKLENDSSSEVVATRSPNETISKERLEQSAEHVTIENVSSKNNTAASDSVFKGIAEERQTVSEETARTRTTDRTLKTKLKKSATETDVGGRSSSNTIKNTVTKRTKSTNQSKMSSLDAMSKSSKKSNPTDDSVTTKDKTKKHGKSKSIRKFKPENLLNKLAHLPRVLVKVPSRRLKVQ